MTKNDDERYYLFIIYYNIYYNIYYKIVLKVQHTNTYNN